MKLTRDESRLLCFLLITLLVGVSIKHYRDEARLRKGQNPKSADVEGGGQMHRPK